MALDEGRLTSDEDEDEELLPFLTPLRMSSKLGLLLLPRMGP